LWVGSKIDVPKKLFSPFFSFLAFQKTSRSKIKIIITFYALSTWISDLVGLLSVSWCIS
jgi:hypothetical protein